MPENKAIKPSSSGVGAFAFLRSDTKSKTSRTVNKVKRYVYVFTTRMLGLLERRIKSADSWDSHICGRVRKERTTYFRQLHALALALLLLWLQWSVEIFRG
jgi:hypothetical protein